eukprot:gb/GEZN01006595.1/.p1 GENE.gb/GEZN01006595.1/~~gb/GEZN01006595.1/.p1  ORF type:complete len:386 (-),score=76.31 gb/GEZN01006595.1/:133-1290(-)
MKGVAEVTMVDPAPIHYYQPLWTLVGGGLSKFPDSARPMTSVIPKGVTLIQEKVAGFKPEQNQVSTDSGKTLDYDFLVVALGLKLKWDAIPGVLDALKNDPRVCSNYSPDYVKKTYPALRQTGTDQEAIFIMPPMPIKCAGAPQKIMWIAQDTWVHMGQKPRISWNTALGVMFGVKKYSDALLEQAKTRDIQTNFQHQLTAVDPVLSTATFKCPDGKQIVQRYDFLHAVPPQGPLEVCKDSPLADAAGWIAVNKDNLQHNKFPNVFSLGDCSSLPTSKTAAAIASQNEILAVNLKAVIDGKEMPMKYDGYTSCPLVTHRDQVMLAEFDYAGQPLETFPFDQGMPRKSMFVLKKDIFPPMYWNALLKGYWGGPTLARKIFHPLAKK